MSSITLAIAQLLGLLLESVLNGIFFTLFVILILLLTHKSFQNQFHRNLLIPVACIMVTFSTAHLVISFVRAILAFAPKGPGSPSDPNAYYSDLGSPLSTAKTCLFIAQTLFGDCVRLWRCYVVFNSNNFILLCSIPLIANLILGAMGAKSYVLHREDLLMQNGLYLTAFISVSLAVNVSCCVAVVYRIWYSSKEIEALRRTLPLIRVIVQSGALYAAALVAVLISYHMRSKGVFVAIDVVMPLVGIVFSFTILQIHSHFNGHSHLNNDLDNIERTSNLPTLGTLPLWRHYFSTATLEQQHGQQYQTGTRSGNN